MIAYLFNNALDSNVIISNELHIIMFGILITISGHQGIIGWEVRLRPFWTPYSVARMLRVTASSAIQLTW